MNVARLGHQRLRTQCHRAILIQMPAMLQVNTGLAIGRRQKDQTISMLNINIWGPADSHGTLACGQHPAETLDCKAHARLSGALDV